MEDPEKSRQVNKNDHKRVVEAFKRKPIASVRDVAKKLHVGKTREPPDTEDVESSPRSS